MRFSDWSSDVCSSDLCRVRTGSWMAGCRRGGAKQALLRSGACDKLIGLEADILRPGCSRCPLRCVFSCRPCRSEEHTSELQSLMRISYAVFCLKKKTHSSDRLRTPN